MQRWISRGLVFRPDSSRWWMRTHACAPVPVHLGQTVYRVYFAGRDDENRSHVGWFDMDLERPDDILAVSQQPVLAPGPLGHFDDHGIYAASAVRDGGSILLYTIGWNPGVPRPLFYASIGRAVSDDNGATFRKIGRAPILQRSEHDPCGVTGPCVLKEGNFWRMWYVSGYRWEAINGTPVSFYNIKYAESHDGALWQRAGVVAIDHATPDERNIARPWIVREGAVYRAWFAYGAGRGYRIGYAESLDGIRFVRRDEEIAFRYSGQGFDDEATAHPAVVCCKGRWYMFYNGNGYGRDGIGLAVAED